MTDGRGDDWLCTDALHFLHFFRRAKTVESIICFPASGKHSKIFRQCRATGHTLLPVDIWQEGKRH